MRLLSADASSRQWSRRPFRLHVDGGGGQYLGASDAESRRRSSAAISWPSESGTQQVGMVSASSWWSASSNAPSAKSRQSRFWLVVWPPDRLSRCERHLHLHSVQSALLHHTKGKLHMETLPQLFWLLYLISTLIFLFTDIHLCNIWLVRLACHVNI